MIALRFESRLAAEPAAVWEQASDMRGVNAELMPLLRMSHPQGKSSIASARCGEIVFASWLLILGCIPVDRHFLRFERILPGAGFDERSSSWTQRVWLHRRRIDAIPGGCVLSDELEFEPRLGLMRPLLRAVVRRLFEHRHRRVRARFGVLPA